MRDAERVIGIRKAIARGEYLLAYDEATSALEASPENLILQYLAVLALARAGATDTAHTRLAELEHRGQDLEAATPEMREDVAALDARLAKDRALRAAGAARERLAADAATRYEEIYTRLGRPYTCINAATMWRVAGDRPRARRLATAALDLAGTVARPSPVDAYWAEATRAEALLLLGDNNAAALALQAAATVLPGDWAAYATTRGQLALLCDLEGVAPILLDALSVPGVLHYCGHRISPGPGGRFPADAETVVASSIHEHLQQSGAGFAYGSLASGADLLVAEAALERGAELHAFLPFAIDEFVEISVAPAGAAWVHRFEACLAAATSVTSTTNGPSLGHDVLFSYCAQVAMGRARIRARFLATEVSQLAVWDGDHADTAVGTAADVAVWRAHHGVTRIVDPGGRRSQERGDEARGTLPSRAVRSMLFADLHGFSRLADHQMPAFHAEVVGPIGATLERFAGEILHRNRWGDGLHVVFSSVRAAARCALALQDAINSIDLDAVGLPDSLLLRVGAHVGPVFEAWDPVCAEPAYFGEHVTRAARIEPGTPEGDVYVTEPFAALLELETVDDLSCQYVGRLPTAKAYGVYPLYLLSAV